MKNEWTIRMIIERYDYFIKDIDFSNMPEKCSQEYRELIFKTANDIIFAEGRYNTVSEWLIELFKDERVQEAAKNLTEIQTLTPEEKTRWTFYMSLKDFCFPLFCRNGVELMDEVWQLGSPDFLLMRNPELLSLIQDSPYRRVIAVLVQKITTYLAHTWELSNPVVLDCINNAYFYRLEHASWKDVEELNKRIDDVVNEIWDIENHMELGKRMGLSHTAQAVYDMLDTFIADRYDYRQVDCAKELATWIEAHWEALNMKHPRQEDIDALWEALGDITAKYNVDLADKDHTWNYICLELLDMSMFSEEQERKWAEEDGVDDFWED